MKADLSPYVSEIWPTVEPTSARTLEPSRRSQRCRLLQLCCAFIARISCPPLLLLLVPALLTSRGVARRIALRKKRSWRARSLLCPTLIHDWLHSTSLPTECHSKQYPFLPISALLYISFPLLAEWHTLKKKEFGCISGNIWSGEAAPNVGHQNLSFSLKNKGFFVAKYRIEHVVR